MFLRRLKALLIMCTLQSFQEYREPMLLESDLRFERTTVGVHKPSGVA